eukprot:jgi/Psemu1/21004/gm1.21004_g
MLSLSGIQISWYVKIFSVCCAGCFPRSRSDAVTNIGYISRVWCTHDRSFCLMGGGSDHKTQSSEMGAVGLGLDGEWYVLSDAWDLFAPDFVLPQDITGSWNIYKVELCRHRTVLVNGLIYTGIVYYPLPITANLFAKDATTAKATNGSSETYGSFVYHFKLEYGIGINNRPKYEKYDTKEWDLNSRNGYPVPMYVMVKGFHGKYVRVPSPFLGKKLVNALILSGDSIPVHKISYHIVELVIKLKERGDFLAYMDVCSGLSRSGRVYNLKMTPFHVDKLDRFLGMK